MIASSISLGALIDKTLLDLTTPAEVSLSVTTSGGLTTAATTDNQLTLVDAGGVNESDLIELGNEVVQVTDKTADAVPILTVQRGYYGTPLSTHAVASIGLVNPMWARWRVAEAVKRAFPRLEAMGVPLVTSNIYNKETDLLYAILPAECRQVYSVKFMTVDGQLVELDRWTFHDDLPTGVYTTGKLLGVGWYVSEDDDLVVTYRTPYRWSTWPATPTESATISLLEGTEDLPASYAAAWLTSRREISRVQIDRAQEWNENEPIRNGVSLSLVRALWAEFYRALDEAKRLYVPPVHRPYRKTQRL